MLRLTVPSGKEKRAILHFLRTIKAQRKLDIPEDTTEYLRRGKNGNMLQKAIDDFHHNRGIFIQRDLIEL